MRPELAMPRALRRTFSALTRPPQQFQLFQPMGGVRAIFSPTMILNFFWAEAREFFAWNVIENSPGSGRLPVIRPVFASMLRPLGKLSTENSMGRWPVA